MSDVKGDQNSAIRADQLTIPSKNAGPMTVSDGHPLIVVSLSDFDKLRGALAAQQALMAEYLQFHTIVHEVRSKKKDAALAIDEIFNIIHSNGPCGLEDPLTPQTASGKQYMN
jgi:hypothetical protein